MAPTSIPKTKINSGTAQSLGFPKEERLPKQSIFQSIKCCTWNIKHGLIKREQELKIFLEQEKIDIIFLTETDTKAIQKESDYQIKGFETFLPIKKSHTDAVRIIALVKNRLVNNIKLRSEIMSGDFPSIWLELTEAQNKTTLLAGSYCEWSHNGEKIIDKSSA